MSISKVSFGFAAGGSDFNSVPNDQKKNDNNGTTDSLPFGGGSGGGVSITPIAFLVVGNSGTKIVPLDNQTHLLDRLIDHVPQITDRIQNMIQKNNSSNTQDFLL
ncbi:putative spore protein YtfJ [compost metagenome]